MATEYKQHQQGNDYCKIKSSVTVKVLQKFELAVFLMSVKELSTMQKKGNLTWCCHAERT